MQTRPKMKLSRLIMIALMATTASMVLLVLKMATITDDSRNDFVKVGQTLVDVEPLRPLSGKARGGAPVSAKDFPDPPSYDTARRPTVPVKLASDTWLQHAQKTVEANSALLAMSPERPTKITLVSAIWDIGRGSMVTSDTWHVFRRPFSHYLNGLKQFLSYKFPKVLYTDVETFSVVKPMIDKAVEDGAGPTDVVIKSLSDLKTEFGHTEAVDEIRNSVDWLEQSPWIKDSPQALLSSYIPVVMSKLRLTRDASRWNPFKTDGFLWLDAGNICHDPKGLTQNKEEYIVRYLDKLLVTTYEFSAVTKEIKGFPREEFNKFLGRSADDSKALTLARGATLGGTREYLEVATTIFDSILAETLAAGYLGTEENILSIMVATVPQLLHRFDNKDKGNCAVFQEFLVPPMNPKLDGYDLRGLKCRFVKEQNAYRCFDKDVQCPDHVTPNFLEVAKGQSICTQERGVYYCTLTCTEAGDAIWQGAPCPTDGVSPCPPWPRTKIPGYNPEDEEKKQPTSIHGPEQEHQVKPDPSPAAPVDKKLRGDKFSGRALAERASEADRKAIEKYGGFNLRGILCEVKGDEERCFYEDTEGRDLCPPRVTSAILTAGDNQYLCTQDTHYCTVTCSEGDRIDWHAHEIKWCDEHKDSCPSKPEIIPIDEYRLPQWSQKVLPAMQCQPPKTGMPKFTVVILAYKEIESLSASLETYKAAQFLEHVDETILYLNARNPDMDKLAEPFTKPPYNVKVMGDSNNYGIATALNWMFGNATNDYVLFLEKDFRLVESLDCVMSQLAEGVKMLDDGTAHVVRYRSRRNPGRPNWARILYKDHEDDVFNRQPNLLCNFFHWIDSPDKRWPEKFYPCGTGAYSDGEADRSKVFYCSKAYYCNWTNNPVLISKKWWHEEYETKFADFKSADPYKDLEYYMNWEGNAWNDRPWVVAQAEGLFKHVDKKKYGM